jgi:hypothetical protein
LSESKIIVAPNLLNNEKEALDYSNFKRKIVKEGIIERKEYKRIKSEYVTKLIKKAQAANLK